MPCQAELKGRDAIGRRVFSTPGNGLGAMTSTGARPQPFAARRIGMMISTSVPSSGRADS